MRILSSTLAFVAVTIAVQAATAPDTIPFWNIDYGKVVLIQGNINQKQKETREVQIKNGKPWELVMTFNYDVGGHDVGQLTIKQDSQVLKTIKYRKQSIPQVRIPESGGGCFFTVPLNEFINVKSKKQKWELDFYYSDERGQENLKLGTIIFKTA